MVKVAYILSVAGWLCTLLALILRTFSSGRLPLTTGADFILSFAFIAVFMYLGYERKRGTGNTGGVVMLIAALLILMAIVLMPQHPSSGALVPALKSPWLTVHVLTAIIAYSGFTLAAGLAVIELRTASTRRDNDIYRIVGVSFAFLSLSIVLGAIWAEQVWGSYWSWDPKETWALITWITYIIYLHLRRQQKWRGKPANLLVIAGFILVLFTFFGVNYLMSGLHSYAITS